MHIVWQGLTRAGEGGAHLKFVGLPRQGGEQDLVQLPQPLVGVLLQVVLHAYLARRHRDPAPLQRLRDGLARGGGGEAFVGA